MLLLGAVAVPIDPRLGVEERRAVARGAAFVAGPLDGGGADAASPRGTTSTRPRSSSTPPARAAAEARRADLRQLAVERARRRASALGLDAEERWLCALPLSHVGGLSILLRSAINATTAIVHERFDTERVLAS